MCGEALRSRFRPHPIEIVRRSGGQESITYSEISANGAHMEASNEAASCVHTLLITHYAECALHTV